MSEVPKAKNAKKIPSNHGILFTEAVKKKKITEDATNC